MEAKQRRNLAKMGGHVATVQQLLGLADADVRVIALRIQLARELRKPISGSECLASDC